MLSSTFRIISSIVVVVIIITITITIIITSFIIIIIKNKKPMKDERACKDTAMLVTGFQTGSVLQLTNGVSFAL